MPVTHESVIQSDANLGMNMRKTPNAPGCTIRSLSYDQVWNQRDRKVTKIMINLWYNFF